MPKMKTHRGAAKRFKLTGTGKVRRRHAFMNHELEKKSPERKRRLNKDTEVAASNVKQVKRQLGI
jgi:large subunit ribosomal protein L35